MNARGVRSLFSNNCYNYTPLGNVQNVKNSRIYVFGNSDVAEDDIVEFEMDIVRSRKGPKSQNIQKEYTPDFVERKLTADDTLQSLSLQYGITISELKRVNRLINDQDFYGLVKIKIPVKQRSFLIDRIHEDDDNIREHTQCNCSTSSDASCLDSADQQSLCFVSENDISADLSDPETQRMVIREIGINRATKSQSKEAQEFLKDMDKDLSKIINYAQTEQTSLEEVISVLTRTAVNPLVVPDKPKRLSYTDCRITWRTSLYLLLLVAVVVPLVIGFLYLYKRNKT